MTLAPQHRNALRRFSLLLLLGLALAGCERSQIEPERLRFGVPPFGDAQSTRRVADPIAAYLSRSLQLPVEVVTTRDPSELVERFRAGELDLVLCSAVPVIELLESPGIDVLATRLPAENIAVGFIARADDARGGLEDFRESTVAVGVGGPSTSIVMAWQHLHERGLDPRAIIGILRVTGNSQISLEELASGSVDLVVTPMFLFDTLTAFGSIPAERLRIVETTAPHPDMVYAAGMHLPGTMRRRIRDALLALSPDEAEDAQVLAVQSAQALLPARTEDFASVRRALEVYRRESTLD